MGVKRIKEHFKIEHIVHKSKDINGNEAIFIGSPYMMLKTFVIYPDGCCYDITISYYNNSELAKLWDQLKNTDPSILKYLYNSPDLITNFIPVYRITGTNVVRTYCEEIGFPNTDIGGELMYDNSHFDTKEKAYKHLLEETAYTVATEWSMFCKGMGRLKQKVKLLTIALKNYLYVRLGRVK
jgi:hypothetical protein